LTFYVEYGIMHKQGESLSKFIGGANMAHNYGLRDAVEEYTPLTGKPIRLDKPYKKVILINAEDCKDRITVFHVTRCLAGSGWFEWEHLLAYWLVEAIVEALNSGETEADISKLFTCDMRGEDFLGEFNRCQKLVIDFLMGRLFECIEENEQVMRVRIIEKAICEA